MQFSISHIIDTPTFLQLAHHYPVGIETINFSVSSILDEGHPALVRYQNELGSLLKERPLFLHGPFFDLSPASFDSQIKAVTINRFEAAYQIAAKLNAKKIIFHTGFLPQVYYIEGWLQNSILFWKEFMENKDSSITICIENVFETDYTPLKNLIETVNHPALKICLDIGHVHAYSSLPLNQWITELSPYISHVHLHNNNGIKDEHLGLTSGSIDMPNCLNLLIKHCASSTVTLEIYDPIELKSSLDFLTDLNLLPVLHNLK